MLCIVYFIYFSTYPSIIIIKNIDSKNGIFNKTSLSKIYLTILELDSETPMEPYTDFVLGDEVAFSDSISERFSKKITW